MQNMYQTFLSFPMEKRQGHETAEDEYMSDVCKAQELLSIVHAGEFGIAPCFEFC